jgi:ribosomal protein L37E
VKRVRSKQATQATPVYCRRCGKRVGPYGTGFLCSSCGAGGAFSRDGYVIARPSQLAEVKDSPHPPTRMVSLGRAGVARAGLRTARSASQLIRLGLSHVREVMLTEIPAGSSVVIGLLVTMVVVGTIVALLAR